MSFENSFKGKTAIVTGGSKGIGRGVCLALNKLGTKVYAIARNPEALKKLKDECPAIETISVDVGNWDALRAAVEKIETVDFLVNNAGNCVAAKLLDSTQEEFDNQVAVNLKAKINLIQIVAKKMIADKRPGSIVNISADVSIKPAVAIAQYSIIYAGIDQLTRVLAIELGPHNIRVNAVNPGPVNTEINDQVFDVENNPEHAKLFKHYEDRMLTPKKSADVKDIVGPILFLLSDASAMITGTLVPVEGGALIN